MLSSICASSKSGSKSLSCDEYNDFKNLNTGLIGYFPGGFSLTHYRYLLKELTSIDFVKGLWIDAINVKVIYDKIFRDYLIYYEKENEDMIDVSILDVDGLTLFLSKKCSLDKEDTDLLKKQKCPGKYIIQQTKQDFISVGFGLGTATILHNWIQDYKTVHPMQMSLSGSFCSSGKNASTSSMSSTSFGSTTDYKPPPEYSINEYYIGSFFRVCVKLRLGIFVD